MSGKIGASAWLGTLPSILALAISMFGLILDAVLDRHLDRYLKRTTSLTTEMVEEIRHIASDRVLQMTCIATLGALVLSLWPLRLRVATDELAVLGIVIALFSAFVWSQVLVAEPGSLSSEEWRRFRKRRISRFELFHGICLAVNAITLWATTPELAAFLR